MSNLEQYVKTLESLEQQVEESQTSSENALVDYLIARFERTEQFHQLICNRAAQFSESQSRKLMEDLQQAFNFCPEIERTEESNDSRIRLLGGLYQLIQEESEFTPLPIDQVERTAKGERGSEIDCSDYLAATLPGQREVATPTGFIDVLTSEQIIEVKYFQYWKHAIGQIQMYGLYYPLHEKRVHLYGAVEEQKLGQITKWSKQVGVSITWEP